MINSSVKVLNQKSEVIQKSKFKIAIYTASLGFVFIFIVGLASPMALHNAAHDVRHSTAFPCH